MVSSSNLAELRTAQPKLVLLTIVYIFERQDTDISLDTQHPGSIQDIVEITRDHTEDEDSVYKSRGDTLNPVDDKDDETVWQKKHNADHSMDKELGKMKL